MLESFKDISPTRIVSYLLFAFSGVMLIGTAVLAFSNMDVLTSWKLILPNEEKVLAGDKKIRAGDRIIVQSVYTKIRNAGGEAIRYLDCKNKDGVVLRYELNRREANRAAKMGGTGIDVTLKTDVPDLPAKCRVAVAICYDTFVPWYCHPESNETKEFTLYPKEVSSAKSESSEQQKTNQTPPVIEGQASNQSVSSSNTTSTTDTQQSNNSQKSTTRSNTTTTKTESEGEAEEERTITGIEPVDNLLKGVGL